MTATIAALFLAVAAAGSAPRTAPRVDTASPACGRCHGAPGEALRAATPRDQSSPRS